MSNMVQTSLRSIIGGMDLNHALTSRDRIKAELKIAVADEAADWGLTVKSVEIQDIKPSQNMQHAMEMQASAERERVALITRSEGEKQAAINKAQGDAAAITAMADATAHAIERIAAAIRQPGGEQAVQLKVAEQAVLAYGKVAADAKTTLIIPGNLTEVSGLIASAMKMVAITKD
jgi:regulator of protease activity HflC (stomatin/prohibitin superfamily)